uniref:EF-hand calcium binding domain 2 n=1 Tax=Stegastes partitus TaxID=144197 RepID=A0A3B5A6K1_9TELE
MSEVHKRIKAAFERFKLSPNTVDVREIGTIMYSLGCFPSQADLHDFIAEVEEDHSGFIHLDRFLPAMTKVLMLYSQVLDKDSKGYLEPEELTKYMTQEGEPFSQEEMDEMLTAFSDQETNVIYYKDIVSQLTIDPGN